MLKLSKPVCETEYVKSNYKYCELCNGLILNLCDHLKSTHKLSKNSKDYINCMSKTVLIPACFVIKQGRTRSIKSVEEITDLEKNNKIGKLTNQTRKNIHVIRQKLNSRTINNESKVQDESVPSTSKSADGDDKLALWRPAHTNYLNDLHKPNVPSLVASAFYIFDKQTKNCSLDSNNFLTPCSFQIFSKNM